jgi:hypothetical protein
MMGETDVGRVRFRMGMAIHMAAPVAPPTPALSATTVKMVFQRNRNGIEDAAAVLTARRARTRASATGPGGRRFAALRR